MTLHPANNDNEQDIIFILPEESLTPDWEKWSLVRTASVHEAASLICNVNPDLKDLSKLDSETINHIRTIEFCFTNRLDEILDQSPLLSTQRPVLLSSICTMADRMMWKTSKEFDEAARNWATIEGYREQTKIEREIDRELAASILENEPEEEGLVAGILRELGKNHLDFKSDTDTNVNNDKIESDDKSQESEDSTSSIPSDENHESKPTRDGYTLWLPAISEEFKEFLDYYKREWEGWTSEAPLYKRGSSGKMAEIIRELFRTDTETIPKKWAHVIAGKLVPELARTGQGKRIKRSNRMNKKC